MSSHKGSISQVIGPVIDVEYDKSGSTMPKIHDALEIDRQDGKKLIIEVQQHIGEDTVRCVAMDSTDGISRGMEVESRTTYIDARGQSGQRASAQCNRRNYRRYEAS